MKVKFVFADDDVYKQHSSYGSVISLKDFIDTSTEDDVIYICFARAKFLNKKLESDGLYMPTAITTDKIMAMNSGVYIQGKIYMKSGFDAKSDGYDFDSEKAYLFVNMIYGHNRFLIFCFSDALDKKDRDELIRKTIEAYLKINERENEVQEDEEA